MPEGVPLLRPRSVRPRADLARRSSRILLLLCAFEHTLGADMPIPMTFTDCSDLPALGLVPNDLGQVFVPAHSVRGGLAIARLSPEHAWQVIHAESGALVCSAESLAHARVRRAELLPIIGGCSVAELRALPKNERLRIRAIIEAVVAPPVRRSRGFLARMLARREWRGAEVAGPLEHTFADGSKALCWQIWRGDALAWIRVDRAGEYFPFESPE